MSQPDAKANRRSSSRKLPKNSTKVSCVPNPHGLGANVALKVFDVSETGVRLVLKSAAKIGQEIEVTLESLADRRPTKTVAKVVWCEKLADGSFCVGAHFGKAIAYGSLLALTHM